MADAPYRNDGVTIACPRCGRAFAPSGRRRFCSAACRQAAWRQRQPVPLPTLPASVALPTMIADGPFRTPGEFAGFLGKRYDPLWALGDPNRKDFRVTELTLPDGVDVKRVADRDAIRSDLAAGLSSRSRPGAPHPRIAPRRPRDTARRR